MMEDISAFSGIRLEPGTLYGAIARLEERGWIRSLEIVNRAHPYEITTEGIRVLKEKVATIERVFDVGKERLMSRDAW